MHNGETNVGVRVEVDAKHDVVLLYPCGVLEDEDDIAVWYSELEKQFGAIGRRVDVVVVLDMLSVDPSVAEIYTKGRMAIAAKYFRHSVRVNASATVSQIIQQTGGPGQYFAPDIASAIAVIEELRSTGRQGRSHLRT